MWRSEEAHYLVVRRGARRKPGASSCKADASLSLSLTLSLSLSLSLSIYLVVGQRAGGEVEQPTGAGGVQARGDGHAGRGAGDCTRVGGSDGGGGGR